MTAVRPLSEVVPVVTDRMVLRLFTQDDVAGLAALQTDPDVVRYLPYDVRTPEQVAAGVTERIEHPPMDGDGQVLRLAAELRATGEMIGELTLFLDSVEHQQGKIGFMLHPAHHGRGLGAEAAGAVLDLAFEWLRLHRVAGECDPRNTASSGLMRRLGMREEARFVHCEWFKGEWGDLQVFAVLAEDWAAARGTPVAP